MNQLVCRTLSIAVVAVFLLAPIRASAVEKDSVRHSGDGSAVTLVQSIEETTETSAKASEETEPRFQCIDHGCAGARSDFECYLVCGENHFDTQLCSCVTIAG